MDNTIMLLLGFIGSMIPIITVIIKLNSTLTKLNVTIETMQKEREECVDDRRDIHTVINNHETRITVLEKGGRYNGNY